MVTAVREQRRTVSAPGGPITYTLMRKSVRNMNLRVAAGPVIRLSVPLRCTVREADDMILRNAEWIQSTIDRIEKSSAEAELLPLPAPEECITILKAAVERVYPRIAPMGVAMPEIRMRPLRSEWGNCHWQKGYITLSTTLARCPVELQDYVALHELVHFLEHDHGSGFYARMDRLMPDWKERRRLLHSYANAIRKEDMAAGREPDGSEADIPQACCEL